MLRVWSMYGGYKLDPLGKQCINTNSEKDIGAISTPYPVNSRMKRTDKKEEKVNEGKNPLKWNFPGY